MFVSVAEIISGLLSLSLKGQSVIWLIVYSMDRFIFFFLDKDSDLHVFTLFIILYLWVNLRVFVKTFCTFPLTAEEYAFLCINKGFVPQVSHAIQFC